MLEKAIKKVTKTQYSDWVGALAIGTVLEQSWKFFEIRCNWFSESFIAEDEIIAAVF